MSARKAFDYSQLPDEKAAELRGLTERGNEARSRIAFDFVEFGRVLIEAKKLLPRAFQRWVRTEFGLSPRTAEHYMAMARGSARVAAKRANIAHWPRTILALIGSAKVPDDIWQRVFDVAETTGRIPTVAEIKRVVTYNKTELKAPVFPHDVTSRPLFKPPLFLNSKGQPVDRRAEHEGIHVPTEVLDDDHEDGADDAAVSYGPDQAFKAIMAWLDEHAEDDDLAHLARMLRACQCQKNLDELADAITEHVKREAPIRMQ